MIGILTTAYLRPQISEVYCLQIERLRETFKDTFLPVVVVSTPEDKALFEGHGIETHTHPNSPLGAKFQHGLDQLRGRVESVLLMGSDNLINDDMLRRLLSRDEELVWPIGLYIYNTSGGSRGEVRVYDWFYKRYSSVGRLMRSSLLDRLDWRIWKGSELRAIDYTSHQMLMLGRPTTKMVPMLPKGMILDIKSSVNMNSYTRFSKGGRVVDSWVWDSLSESEQEALGRLCQQ